MVPSIGMKYYEFNLGSQLKGFWYCYSTPIILFHITHYEILLIQFRLTVKGFLILLFHTNNSIPYYSFICRQLNGSKYWYEILLIQFRLTVKGFLILLFHTNNSIPYYSFICRQLNGSKYWYEILWIQFRLTFKGFLILLFHTDNSIPYYSFICRQLNVSKYYYITIQFNISYLFTHS